MKYYPDTIIDGDYKTPGGMAIMVKSSFSYICGFPEEINLTLKYCYLTGANFYSYVFVWEKTTWKKCDTLEEALTLAKKLRKEGK